MNKSNLENISPKKDRIRIIFALSVIVIIGFILRLVFFPFEIPLILDNLSYFWYAMDMSITGEFPQNYDIVNNTWPTILSVFFSIFFFENYIDYMNLQRGISSIISVLAVIPIYFLSRHFFSKKVALVGSAMFAFEPRLIQNSLLGITEPLFLLLGITTICLFLRSNMRVVYLSFVTAGLFTLVRYEGVLIIIPMTILFFVRFKKEKKVILKYVLALTIFLILLLPMSTVRMSTMGYDGVFSHVKSGAVVVTSQNFLNEDPTKQKFFPDVGIINFIKLFGWILVPSFIFFIPLGILSLIRKKEVKIKYLILFTIFATIPAFYAYSRGISDTRYLFMVYPMFVIISLYSIDWITQKNNKKNWVFITSAVFLISTSWAFLDIKIDNEHDVEAFQIALKNTPYLSAVNVYYPESTYYKVTILDEISEFPILNKDIHRNIKLLPTNNFNSIEEFLTKNEKNGLEHIVIDDSIDRPQFLREIFTNEEKYPYLEKVYDSNMDGYDYKVKIFKINFEKFHELRDRF